MCQSNVRGDVGKREAKEIKGDENTEEFEEADGRGASESERWNTPGSGAARNAGLWCLSLWLRLVLVVLHLDPLAQLPETRRGVHGGMEEEAKEAVEKQG